MNISAQVIPVEFWARVSFTLVWIQTNWTLHEYSRMKCAKSCSTSWNGVISCTTQPCVHWALLSEAAVFTGKAKEWLDCTWSLKLTPAVKDYISDYGGLLLRCQVRWAVTADAQRNWPLSYLFPPPVCIKTLWFCQKLFPLEESGSLSAASSRFSELICKGCESDSWIPCKESFYCMA